MNASSSSGRTPESSGGEGSARVPRETSVALEPRPIEIELKYLVTDHTAVTRYLAAEHLGSFAAAGSVRTTQVEDRYVDSADRALSRAGYATRLRRGPKGTVVTVKSRQQVGPGDIEAGTARIASASAAVPAANGIAGAAGPNGNGESASASPPAAALHRREELEGPADLSTGAAQWPASVARSVVLELCGDAPLVEIVTVRQLRQTRALRAGRSRAELSLDEVEVISGGRVVGRFEELEVEHKAGDDGPLVALATELDRDPALAPSTVSKLQRAMAALQRAKLRPRDGGRDEDDGSASEAPADAGSSANEATVGARKTRGSADSLSVGRAGANESEPERATETGRESGSGRESDEAPPVPAEKPALPRTPGVTGDDTLAEAGRKVLRFHYARMLAREPGTRSGDDPEELHGMRVATRRMRAAWRVFGEGFRPRRTRRLRSRLRVVAGRLGAVRDPDVLIDGLERYQAELPEEDRGLIEPLLEAWRAQRDAARTLLLRELDSTAYQTLVEEYAVFVRTEGEGALPLASPTTPHRVRDTAPAHIWSAYGALRAYERVLPWADIETVHQLRIAGKWLRYTLEFFREALGPDTPALIARVVSLQDHLGLLHDADVGAGLARAFLVERSGGLSDAETAAIGRYLRTQERELARLRRSLGPTWRALIGPTFRRALGRAVAAL